jgi:hypothetical protein
VTNSIGLRRTHRIRSVSLCLCNGNILQPALWSQIQMILRGRWRSNDVRLFRSGSGQSESFKNLHVHGGRDLRWWSTDAVVPYDRRRRSRVTVVLGSPSSSFVEAAASFNSGSLSPPMQPAFITAHADRHRESLILAKFQARRDPVAATRRDLLFGQNSVRVRA